MFFGLFFLWLCTRGEPPLKAATDLGGAVLDAGAQQGLVGESWSFKKSSVMENGEETFEMVEYW